MIYIGIDPGSKGGFAIINSDGQVQAYPWDNEKFRVAMALIRADVELGHGNAICCLEHVWAVPIDGKKQSFKLGEFFGYIRGVLGSNKIPYELVRPQKWKKEFSVTADKNTSIEVCKRLFPDVNLLATPKCRKPHDGMAEALLMSEYARRKLGGGE